MTIAGGFGGIHGSSAPGAPADVVAIGGIESATVSWTVTSPGGSSITAFVITPYLAGEIALEPITVDAGSVNSVLSPATGAHDRYVASTAGAFAFSVPDLMLGNFSFSVAVTNESVTGPATMSNVVAVTPPSYVAPPPSIPHLMLPFTIGPNGSFLTIEQGSIEEVAQSVEVILGTPIGSRTQVPSFGVPIGVFAESAPNPKVLEGAVAIWEPRALTTISVGLDNTGGVTVTANVELASGVRTT